MTTGRSVWIVMITDPSPLELMKLFMYQADSASQAAKEQAVREIIKEPAPAEGQVEQGFCF